MTGLWPARLGMTEAAGHVERVDLHAVAKTTGAPWQKAACPWGGSRLDTKYPTLAKSLKAADYATGHFGKWHLGREPYDPLHQGFDLDVPHTYGPAQPSCYYAPWKWPEGVKDDKGRPGEFVDDRMADEAIRFMKAHRQGPFYCNFWMFSPHGGPQGKPNLVEKYTRKLATLPADYPQRNPDTASLIEEMDRVVGRMANALEDLGIADRTLCFFPHYDHDLDAPGASVRQGDWKLIRRFFGHLDHKPDQADAYGLYNLRDDIGESYNLASAQPDKVQELDAALSGYLRDTGAVLPVKNPKYDCKAPEPSQEHR